MMGMALHVVKTDGVLALYNGLSASLCRQVCVCEMSQSVLELVCVVALVRLSFVYKKIDSLHLTRWVPMKETFCYKEANRAKKRIAGK